MVQSDKKYPMSTTVSNLSRYFSFLARTVDFWEITTEKSLSIINLLVNKSEQLRQCLKSQLSEEFSQRFPGVKEKLLGKIQCVSEEEIVSLNGLLLDLKSHVDDLKLRLDELEKTNFKLYLENEINFNSLIPSNEILIEYASDAYKCFYLLWLSAKTCLDMIELHNMDSVIAIQEAFSKYKQSKAHLQFILDLTLHVRGSAVVNELGIPAIRH